MLNMFENYQKNVVPKLKNELGLENQMAVPSVKKVVINMGIGDLRDNKEEQEKAAHDLGSIAGQKPLLRKAKKAISGFGIRKDQVVGAAVTLRGKKMYDFLQKLFNIVLPRLRDFKGLPKNAFDQGANYTLGVTEHTVFPEIDLAKVGRPRGLEITIVTSTRDKERAKLLLEELGLPLEKEETKK